MSQNPLISILIATKNRQKYCLSAVQSILNIKDDRIQVIVQDNSDDTSLKEMLLPYMDDKRLLYNYIPGILSFVDNFSAAINLATGIYVCAIGDDDGINPEIIAATKWANDNNYEALVGNVEANYRWEGTGAPDTFFTKMTDNTLTITHFNGKAKVVVVEDSLQKLMANGATNYLDFDFPKLYHGIVKKTVFEKIKQKTGAYLKGLSPDIYAAIALACNVEKLLVIDYPLTIPGVCKVSGSIQEGQKKSNSKKLEDAPHFKGNKNHQWAEQVPNIYCVQTIWADSAFAAIKEFKREDLISKFDKYMLYANILDADPGLKPLLLEFIDKTKGGNTLDQEFKNINKAKLKGPYKKFLKRRALGRMKKILKIERYEIINNLKDMSEVTDALVNYLSKLNIDIIKEFNKIK